MKKFLTMALALMMVLSLFAVPTMAATMAEQYAPGGDFESFAVGTTAASAGFSSSGSTTATVVNIAAERLPANGTNNQQAFKVALSQDGKGAEFRSAAFDILTGEEYTVSFDYLIVSDEAPDQKYYGVGFPTPKSYFFTDGAWSTSTRTYASVAVPTIDSDADGRADKMETGTWTHFETKLKPSADKTGAYIAFKSVNALSNVKAGTVAFYIDNLSITKEVPAATVTKTVNGNGTVTGIESGVVGFGSTYNLTLTPASTSYLKSLTVDGTDVTSAVTQTWDQTLGNYVGTYAVTVNADTAIVATFADYVLVKKVDESMEDIDYEIGSLNHTTETWGKSGTAVATIETDAKYGQYIKVTDGEVRTPKHTMELGLYKFSFDAKADTAGVMKLQHGHATSGSTGNGMYNGLKAGTADINITNDWAHYECMFELLAYAGTDTAETERNLTFKMNTTAGLCIDNVKAEYYSKTAAPQPPVVEPTEFAVTISGDAGAKVSVAAATSEGEAVDFTVAPKFGYYIAGITVGGTPFPGFEAYKGGTYSTGAIAADTAIVVTTASLADNTDANVSTEVATLPAVFAEADNAVTFGKVLDRTNATSWGVELTKDGVGVTPYHGGSYLYQANATSASGQYAIEFIGLEAGTYQIRSYVYVNGTPEFGAPSTFVVAE